MAALLPAAVVQKHFVWRAAATLLPLLWICSSLNLRWREGHAQDGCRTATADAATVFIYLPRGPRQCPRPRLGQAGAGVERHPFQISAAGHRHE